MFQTRITELFGIKYPIIQGAMLWLSRAELAAEVSNAGGLGIIDALSHASPEDFRQEIRKMKSLTDKPFAVNITLLPTKRPIQHEEYISAAIEEGVKIIETSGRNPRHYMAWFKEANVKVMHKVARKRDAVRAEQIGVDAVTIVGFEAGGHPGMEDIGSLVRIPACVDAVKIPVIAAGGFADGRGLVAGLALGADAVLMATRFMLSKECAMHQHIKDYFLQADETGTMLVERSINMAARVMGSGFSEKILEMEMKGATPEELIEMLDGQRGKKCLSEGITDESVLYSGQSAGLIHDVPSVKEIMASIISEAEAVINKLS